MSRRTLALVPRAGQVTPLHDCGRAGRLTAEQIAKVAGVRVSSIYRRLRNGVTGEALIAGRCAFNGGGKQHQYREKLHVPDGISASAWMALNLAREFPDRVPPATALQRKYEMSRATAYRWRAAWREVLATERARA